MLTVTEAVNKMLQAVPAPTSVEHISIEQAVDRVLATPIDSTINVPAYDNSAMDGYALRAADLSNRKVLTLAGTSLAGHPYPGELQPGTCIRIMTGAEIPVGADTVVPQENAAELDDNKIRFARAPAAGDNIRRQGEELRQGAGVYPYGRRLTPIDIGLLASLGIAEVKVYRQLRLALFSTGDELVAPGRPLDAGQIYDSNRYHLKAILERLGYLVEDLGLIPDDPKAIEDAFRRAARVGDAIICSGGVSVGAADYTKQVIDDIGQVGFWKVAMKPGKPFAFGTIKKTWFFGLPGNPVSATVTLDQLAVPILAKLAGEQLAPSLKLTAVAGEAFKKKPGRADFQRGILRQEDGVNKVYSAGSQSSAMLSSLVKANCYVLLSQHQSQVQPGQTVSVELIPRYLR